MLLSPFFVFSELRWDMIVPSTFYYRFNPAIFKPVLNQNLDFQHPLFVFSELRWDVIVPSTFYYRFNPAKCKPVLCQNIDFQRLMSFSSFCVQWVKVKGDCSLCWYWWNCWPSLFKLTFHNTNTGARCVRKKPKNYIILQGGELTCFHFLSRRVKLIVTSERLNIFKKKISFPKRSQLLV
jgi:hypothetical protein